MRLPLVRSAIYSISCPSADSTRFGHLQSEGHSCVRQLVGYRRGSSLIKRQIHEFAPVAEQFRGEVLVPGSAQQPHAGLLKQPPDGIRPFRCSRPAEIIAADDDRPHRFRD